MVDSFKMSDFGGSKPSVLQVRIALVFSLALGIFFLACIRPGTASSDGADQNFVARTWAVAVHLFYYEWAWVKGGALWDGRTLYVGILDFGQPLEPQAQKVCQIVKEIGELDNIEVILEDAIETYAFNNKKELLRTKCDQFFNE